MKKLFLFFTAILVACILYSAVNKNVKHIKYSFPTVSFQCDTTPAYSTDTTHKSLNQMQMEKNNNINSTSDSTNLNKNRIDTMRQNNDTKKPTLHNQ